MKTTAIFFATGLALGLLVGGLLFSSADTDGDPAGSSPTLETPELRPRAGSRAATATRTAEAVAYVATSAPRSRGAERAHAEPADPDDADAGIAGIVVDGAGRPVSHIVVEAKLAGTPVRSDAAPPELARARSGASGRYRIRGLKAGATYAVSTQLTMSDAEAGSAWHVVNAPESTEEITAPAKDVVVRLACGLLDVRIEDPPGDPAPSRLFARAGDSVAVEHDTTRRRIRLAVPLEIDVRLVVVGERIHPLVETVRVARDEGVRSIVLAPQRDGPISDLALEVVDEVGVPVSTVSVAELFPREVELDGWGSGTNRMLVDERGVHRVPGLGPGKHRLLVQPESEERPDLFAREIEVGLDPAAPVRQRVVLPAGGRIRIRVAAGDGRATGLNCRLESSQGDEETATLDLYCEGLGHAPDLLPGRAYESTGWLAPGTYVLTWKVGNETRTAKCVVRPREMADVAISVTP